MQPELAQLYSACGAGERRGKDRECEQTLRIRL